MAPAQVAHRGFQLRWLVAGLFGSAAATLVIIHSGAAFLVDRSPRMALLLNADEPSALLVTAQNALQGVVSDFSRAQAEEQAAAKARATPARRAQSPVTDPAGAKLDTSPAAGAADNAGLQAPTAPALPGLLAGAPAAQTIATSAKRALMVAPLEGRALRLLAQLADAAGDTAQKHKLLEATVRRTKGDALAVYWLLLDAHQKNDEKLVVHYADMLMSKYSTMDQIAVPVMARQIEVAQNLNGGAALKARLAENPRWRAAFLKALPAASTDARTPLDILLTLKATAHPPTGGEIGLYLDFLMRRKLYEVAYYTWLQFLDPQKLASLTSVNNGNFEADPAGGPFDWSIPASVGAIVEIKPPPGLAGRALNINFVGQGRVDFQPVRQTLTLAPGRYRLQYKQRGEVNGRRGLLWVVTCVDAPTRIGEGPMFMGKAPDWKLVNAEVVVPAENCRAQILQLVFGARSASEQLVSGEAWFDDVGISRESTE